MARSGKYGTFIRTPVHIRNGRIQYGHRRIIRKLHLFSSPHILEKDGDRCYTDGLEQFGRDEIEVLNTDAQPKDLRAFLISLASYVLENNLELHDGETIGFSEEDKHSITRSEGEVLPGMTLKISYSPMD